ncbi:DeoR/GlpR family DNA-binding transcription regulator [Sporolactobacillus pectinivorans]|uniref:DeoR/GlpR family DNA-binding transcription regulator n=1 Tax=Sporolactobacillus pectinivorans TaxID=1591408 RepID=UPI000C263ABF|nr:DeoR/GlpR family DNA-binding transcription regulator [Sporolactobacillus pectinivorans]
MLAEERQQIILRRLAEVHVLKLQDLVKDLNASESTVRRDLKELEACHLLRRVHGGASLLQPRSEELDMETKTSKNVQQKKAIARMAADQIRDNECIYLDAGTTTLEMIPYIRAANVTVVTNGPAHGEELARKNVLCYLIGGMMKRATKAVIGSMAANNLNLFRFDKAFIGANGIDVAMGFTTPDPEEAALKRQAQLLSAQTFVIADSSKFSEVSFCKMFNVDQAVIITDMLPDAGGSELVGRTKIYCADSKSVLESESAKF